jgi:hypothetical protein
LSRADEETPKGIQRNPIAFLQRSLDFVENTIDYIACLTPRDLRADRDGVNHISFRQRRISRNGGTIEPLNRVAAFGGYTQGECALLPTRNPALTCRQFAQRAERQQVTSRTEAAHRAAASGRRNADTAKLFSCRNVGKMHFDDGNAD